MYVEKILQAASGYLKSITEFEWRALNRRSIQFDWFMGNSINIIESADFGLNYLCFGGPGIPIRYYSINKSDMDKFIEIIDQFRIYNGIKIPRSILFGECNTDSFYLSYHDQKYEQGFASMKVKVTESNLSKAVEALMQLLQASEVIEVMEN